jgi:hypothetical protein
MKTFTLLASLLAVSIAGGLRAENATNTRQLEELRALSFGSVRKVLVARLAAPAKGEEAAFHGCALRSEWKEVAPSEAQALAELLSALITDRIRSYTEAGDDALIELHPFGPVYGEVGLRLETDKGRREFSISFAERTDYVYAYDTKKHVMCFTIEGVSQGQLGKILTNQASQPTPLKRGG